MALAMPPTGTQCVDMDKDWYCPDCTFNNAAVAPTCEVLPAVAVSAHSIVVLQVCKLYRAVLLLDSRSNQADTIISQRLCSCGAK